ncbi:unnamed protein product [Angiostrongylus costaricensis]|uniref:Peptide-N(4)-(N-acetyl-beta-glucosaminyl)asparagine amidase n=1 Tax=Angiostrongylus costaricensis TaxID=334426 RepID=A0A0R3PCW9_ANGCS|nr:unnamed protein product [Angiostrongylus costaricensis]
MPVQLANNLADLRSKINSADLNHLFVVDFFADWCAPCRAIAPLFEQFSGRFTNATFLKVNVDYSPDISRHYGVRAMPTFVLIKKGKEMERIQGANPQALEQAINRHYSSTPANPNAASESEKRFLQQFVPQTEKVIFIIFAVLRLYSDIVYKTLALSLIPVEKLKEESTGSDALLNWFKNEFFSWCDSPICDSCGSQTAKGSGLNGTPTPKEHDDGADRVEIYQCSCGREVRFPRYNDPAKLLETRKGRCGEWANCFALMASAMDFDTRFVYDVTDHVWVELWITESDNWVHCDPCENVVDRPLLYEKGWGKKLSYVLAFGFDHVCDVTWRYSVNHKKTLRLRKSVREAVLSNFLMKLNTRMAAAITPERALELRRRRIRELVDFLVIGERLTNGEVYGGRISGEFLFYILFFILLEYNCAEDCYTRGTEKIAGWSTFANSSGFIQRKKETDWKMAYLCRQEGESDAEVKHFSEVVRAVFFGTTIFESGSVLVTVCAGDVCLAAHLSGGTGSNAFQHAQLFRTSLDNRESQMKIEIELV